MNFDDLINSQKQKINIRDILSKAKTLATNTGGTLLREVDKFDPIKGQHRVEGLKQEDIAEARRKKELEEKQETYRKLKEKTLTNYQKKQYKKQIIQRLQKKDSQPKFTPVFSQQIDISSKIGMFGSTGKKINWKDKI